MGAGAMVCGLCKAQNREEARFCGQCGAALGSTAPCAHRAAQDGMRRQVTVLFADMEGYSALAEKLGEEGTYALMQPVLASMVESVRNHGGTTQDLAGDGVMALFGAPHALEDAPLRACRAALDIQRRMEALAPGIAADHKVAPRFRVGLNVGPVVLGSLGEGERIEVRAVGDTVNLASRLQSLAEPGTVLLSDELHRLVQGHVEDTALGDREIKGKSQPVRVFRLDAVPDGTSRFQASVSRGLTALVGRQRELDSLEQAWTEALAGATRIVDLVGEAGMGKSRLLHEFCARRQRTQAFVMRGQCQQGGRGGPFHPFADIVRGAFRIAEREPSESARAKLGRGIELLGADGAHSAPYLLNLLGYAVEGDRFATENAEVAGIRTRELLILLLKERCLTSEVLVVIEDAHWIDKSSEDLLQRALGQGFRLMQVCTYRPQYTPPWAQVLDRRVLRLEPLSARETEELLRCRLEAQDLPGVLVRLVVARAEGNPLFAEEIATYLASRGAIKPAGAGVGFDGAAAQLLPASLENMLMERIGGLAGDARALLQAASVIGRRFALDVAAQAAGLDGAAAKCAQQLEAIEVIFSEPQSGNFRFKHALLQEAVLQSLLSARRAELHRCVAEALERKYGEQALEIADALADHYGATPQADKAARYMRAAGEKALRVYSLDEAELRFRQVIELMERVPGCADDAFFVDTLLNVSRVLYYKAHFNALIELVSSHLPLVERLGDPARLGRFLFELGYAHCFNAEPQIGKPLLERALAIAEDNRDERLIAYASMGLMWEHMYWEPATALTREAVRALSARAVGIGRRLDDRWVTVKALMGPPIDDVMYGRPMRARREALRMFEYSRDTGDPRARTLGHASLAWADLYLFDYAGAVQNAEELLRSGLSPLDRMGTEVAKGIALIFSARADEGVGVLQRRLAQIEARGWHQLRYSFDTMLGLGLVVKGEWSRGVRYIEQSIERAKARNASYLAAVGHFALGEVYTQVALGEAEVKLRTMLANPGFVIGSVPRAASKARAHLEPAVAGFRAADAPAFLAWSLLDLGLLARKKNPARARPLLEEARQISRDNELGELARRSEAALAPM